MSSGSHHHSDPTSPQSVRARHVVTSDGVLDRARVEITDGVISAITADAYAPGHPQTPDDVLEGWLVPGFVDTHVHGGGGGTYTTTDPEEALRVRDFHRRHGTTTSFASLVTDELDELEAQLRTLAPLVAAGHLAGIHLEGPFLSSLKCGAHEPSLLRSPDAETIDRLLDAGQGYVSMVTIAPELPGALEAILRFESEGVMAAFGHSDADEVMTARALDAGVGVVTHLFNAMRPIHHRVPGPVPRLLTDDRVVIELICDGFHLHRDVITMAVHAAGVDRVALITDAMVAAGMDDGQYQLGALRVSVVDGMARLIGTDGQPGSIAGSTLTMAAAFAFVVSAGIPIPDVARMAATTPARTHGLAPQKGARSSVGADGARGGVGEIAVGARADLCLVDDHGVLQQVMQTGRWVERS